MKNFILLGFICSLFFVITPQQVHANQKAPSEVRLSRQLKAHKAFLKGKKDITSFFKKKRTQKRQKDQRITNPFSIASLSCSLGSILTIFVGLGFLWFPAALAGIVFGIIGLVQTDRYYDEFKGREMAIAGIITGAISLLIPIFLFILFF